jgi:uncharacterized protein YkwD
MRKIIIIFTLGLAMIFSLFSCAPAETGTVNGILENELRAMQVELNETDSELQATKNKLIAAQSELDATQRELSTTEKKLNDTFIEAGIKTQYEELSFKYEQLTVRYKELDTKYQALEQQYDDVLAGTAEIGEIVNEADIEQALFGLINEERQNNGFSPLIWNDGLYSSARNNNSRMQEAKSFLTSECPSFQQAFWFLGYGTADKIANTTLMVWKNNQYSFRQNVLNKATIGAVAVSESEGILYIDFLSYTDVASR